MVIYFHNIEESDMVRDAVNERLQDTFKKFPEMRTHKIYVTLRMDNSPQLPGPQQFTVKLHIFGNKYNNIIVEKSDPSLYRALALLANVLPEKLNRKKFKQTARWKAPRLQRETSKVLA